MPAFRRDLSDDQINGLLSQVSRHPDGLIADLMRLWRPSGVAIAAGERGLRLGVRNGYLNLYRFGQSVAKLKFDGRSVPSVELYGKYLAGVRKPSTRAAAPVGLQGYKTLSGDRLSVDYRGSDELAAWIDTAATYAGAEKIFVDGLVGANPGVIDLEMGLPAGPSVRTARRRRLRAWTSSYFRMGLKDRKSLSGRQNA